MPDSYFPFLTGLAAKYGKAAPGNESKVVESKSVGRAKWPNLLLQDTAETCFCEERGHECDHPPQEQVFMASDKLDEALGWCWDEADQIELLRLIFQVPLVACVDLHSLWKNVYSKCYLPVLKDSAGGLGGFRPYAIQCKMFQTNLVAWAKCVDNIAYPF